MERNESVTRAVMLLCFGTALLSLAVHWRMTSSTTSETGLATNRRQIIGGGAALAEEPWKLFPNSRNNTVSHSSPKSPLAQIFAQAKSLNSSPKKQLVVDLSDRRVYVYRSDQVVIASYPIGVGKKGWETPTGRFQVMYKQPFPVWRHPITDQIFPAGSDSPLGDRWIGFWKNERGDQIGFHGTPDEELIGSPVSHGCLRMRNRDVRLLYRQVSIGTPVEVRE